MPGNQKQPWNEVPLNRRRLLKSIGVVSGIAIPGVFADPAVATVSFKRVVGDELKDLTNKVVHQADALNVVDSRIRKTILTGEFVEICESGDCITVVSREASRVGKTEGVIDLVGDDLMVAAANHKLGSGNRMTAVSFFTSDNQALAFYDYSAPEDGVTSRAELWKTVEKGDETGLSLQKASYNGALTRSVSVMNGQVSSQADPCGGCHCQGPGDPDPGYELKNICTDITTVECALNTGICGSACVPGCVLGGVPGCIVCVLSACPYALVLCCDTNEECRPCGCFS